MKAPVIFSTWIAVSLRAATHLNVTNTTIIDDIWVDDFAADISGRHGWYIFNNLSDSTGSSSFNPIFNSSSSLYHGIFVQSPTESILYREFKCNRASQVYMSFSYALCPVTPVFIQLSVHVLDVNGRQISGEGDIVLGPLPLADDTFYENLKRRINATHCDDQNEWNAFHLTNLSLGNVSELNSWDSQIVQSYSNHSDDTVYSVLYGIQIECRSSDIDDGDSTLTSTLTMPGSPTPQPTLFPSTSFLSTLWIRIIAAASFAVCLCIVSAAGIFAYRRGRRQRVKLRMRTQMEMASSASKDNIFSIHESYGRDIRAATFTKKRPKETLSQKTGLSLTDDAHDTYDNEQFNIRATPNFTDDGLAIPDYLSTPNFTGDEDEDEDDEDNEPSLADKI